MKRKSYCTLIILATLPYLFGCSTPQNESKGSSMNDSDHEISLTDSAPNSSEGELSIKSDISGNNSVSDTDNSDTSNIGSSLFSSTSSIEPQKYIYKKYDWEYSIESKANNNVTSIVTLDLNSTGKSVNSGIYSAGYDGWGDITERRSVDALKDINLKYLRIAVDMDLATGDIAGGAVDITCKAQKDGNLSLLQRIETARENGFTPIIVFTTNYVLPTYFYPSTDKLSYWFQYNTDGTKATDSKGNQIDEYARIAGEVAKKLKAGGAAGLMWESIYEIGYGMEPFNNAPIYIHYKTAKAIKDIDPTSTHIGPATWAGWAVEKFVDDYFNLYGAAGAKYLDFVSFHQYGGNYIWNKNELWDYTKQYISMTKSDNHTQYGSIIKNLTLLKLLSSAPKAAADSVSALKSKLSQKASQYGFAKKIGVAITEYDVNNYSNYLKNPDNADYPNYSAASDTNINTNYFGGVNTAYMLAACALSDVDMLLKFNTRQYYGIVDHDYANNGLYYRTPVWFSYKLLQDRLGLSGSNEIISAAVDGPRDTISGFDDTWIYACAVKKNGKTNILIINRGDTPSNVKITIKNLPAGTKFTRYVYGENTTAKFIGNFRPLGNEYDGMFEGGIDDGWSDYQSNELGTAKNICLFPMGTINPLNNQIKIALDMFSYTILEMN